MEAYEKAVTRYERVARARREQKKEMLLEPFSLRHATAGQREAIEAYALANPEIGGLRGMATWMMWKDKTYYDILREIYGR